MRVNSGFRRGLRRGPLVLSLCVVAVTVPGLCGCTSLSEWVHNGFKVGPNYQAPPAPVTGKWVDQDNPRVHVGNPNLATWWDVFNDPILAGLVKRSYDHNLTVRAAGMQILQAKAQRAIAIGELLPQSQSFNIQYSRGEVSRNGGAAAGPTAFGGTGLAPTAVLSPLPSTTLPIAGVTPVDPSLPTSKADPAAPATSSSGPAGTNPGFFTNIALGTNLTWELDVWGLFRRNLEAANATLDQTVDNYDEMLVLLFANVATQYVEIRTLQRRLELARRNVAMQEPLVDAFYKRYKAGIANSKPGYYQLKSNLDNTRALIPTLEISLRQANNQLCTLLGMPVRDLLPELGDGVVPDPTEPNKQRVAIPRPFEESVVVGIPGELLLSRPDVQSAERQLQIQSAQIGIAEGEMYPHMGINGAIGLAADKLPLVFDSKSWTGTIGPSLTWNILNYGRLLANVRFQDFQYLQDVALYQSTVLNANQDAENALVAYLQSLDQARYLKDSADAAVEVTTYLYNQLKEGFLPPGAADTSAFINLVFTAVNFQVTQQDAAAQAEGNIALNLILLYRAMGGGWQIRLDHPLDHECQPADDFSLPVTAAQLPQAGPSDALPQPRPVPVPEQVPAPQPLPPAPGAKKQGAGA
jgi:NodT family efflux transporter outer membrane factor (OMF) lipoprotein